jgi:hypothetical protein
MRHEIVDGAIIRPDHAGLARPAQQRVGIGEKAFRRNQDVAVTRQFRAIGDMDERIGRYSCVLNEWHRPAP